MPRTPGWIVTYEALAFLRARFSLRDDCYWHATPGAHWAEKEPCAVTVPGPPDGSVAVKVKVPRTDVDDELVITNWPVVELNACMLPPLV